MVLDFMLLHIAGFAIGLGPVFWLLISEIYPLRMRGPAMAVATLFNWALNFGVSFTFLSWIQALCRPGFLRADLLLVLRPRDQGQEPGGNRKGGPRQRSRGAQPRSCPCARAPALRLRLDVGRDGLPADILDATSHQEACDRRNIPLTKRVPY